LPTANVDARPAVALSNSFGFGGHNATLVMGAA
jgi:3-oxoacyl-(acyl-carrier-protein) synthase